MSTLSRASLSLLRIFALPVLLAACTGDTTSSPDVPTGKPDLSTILSGCTNGVPDGDETGTDCGGSCPGCGVDQPCLKGTDCESTFCVNKKCTASTCTD